MLEAVGVQTSQAMFAFRRLLFFLSGHLEEKVEAKKKESDVRGPSSEKWRQLPNAAHCFQQARRRPIDDSDRDAQRYSSYCAARADQEREGNRQKHDDGCDQRK